MAGAPGKRLAAYIEADIRRESWLQGKYRLRPWTVDTKPDSPLLVEDVQAGGAVREIAHKDDWLRIKQRERRAARAAGQSAPDAATA